MAIDTQISALLVRALRAPSEFYRQRLVGCGLGAASELGSAALAQLPLTRREELVRDQLASLPHGTRRFADAAPPVRVGVTGSGPDLLVLTWTAADLARERAAGARVLGALGITPGMRVANTLPGALATPGALLLGDVIEELGALDIPLGSIDTDAAARPAWELFDRVHPDVMILDPATAFRLFAAAPAARRPWWPAIVWLRTVDGAWRPPTVPAEIGFTGSQRSWLAVPEATSFVASSCTAERFHLDHGVLAEIVDAKTGAPLPPGQPGTLALTPLESDAALLRYASELRARTLAVPCICGGGGMAIEII